MTCVPILKHIVCYFNRNRFGSFFAHSAGFSPGQQAGMRDVIIMMLKKIMLPER